MLESTVMSDITVGQTGLHAAKQLKASLASSDNMMEALSLKLWPQVIFMRSSIGVFSTNHS